MATGPSTMHKPGMVNLDVLDCKICLHPLTVPVYQCKNGHAVCETCLQKLKSECPTCRLQIDGRCRQLEEIIESVKVKCKNRDYGCTDLILYINNRDEHEKNCIYSIKTFKYDDSFGFELWKNQKICVLKEAASGDVFVLNNETATCGGNKISVSFVNPASPVSRKEVEVKVTVGGSDFKFSGPTPTARSISDKSHPPALLYISSGFLGSNDSFLIVLKLRRRGFTFGFIKNDMFI